MCLFCAGAWKGRNLENIVAFRIKTGWRVLEGVSPDLSHSNRKTPSWTLWELKRGLCTRARSRTSTDPSGSELWLHVTAGRSQHTFSAYMLGASSTHAGFTSRSRKVKCERRDQNQCQACFEARLACTFRDKERYYAEKGRPASRGSHSSGHSHHSSTTSHHSPTTSHSSSSSNSRKHSPGNSSSSTSSGRSPQQSDSPTLRMDVPCGMTADAQQYELSLQPSAS